MRCALEQVIDIVTEARGDNRILPASIHDGIKDFKVATGISWKLAACSQRKGLQGATGVAANSGRGRGWKAQLTYQGEVAFR